MNAHELSVGKVAYVVQEGRKPSQHERSEEWRDVAVFRINPIG